MSEIYILGFEGKSLIPSKMIQWQTASWCSHVAVQLRDGRIVESVMKGGVATRVDFDDLSDHHKPGTGVKFYRFKNEIMLPDKMEEFLLDQVGRPYDWVNVFRFVGKPKSNHKWFCSELVAQASMVGGTPLQEKPPARMNPDHCVISRELIEDRYMRKRIL